MSSYLEEIIKAALEERERKRRAATNFFSALHHSQPFSTLLTPKVERRKIFVSYHHGDEDEVQAFIEEWGTRQKVFIPKALGISEEDDFIDSDNPEYVMSQIREKYLGDSTVTIILLGSCTHSRRYVDWEIKASLRQGMFNTPNGLIGITLPSLGGTAHLPPRLEENWTQGHIGCYARFYVAPNSVEQLRGWIEDAYSARTARVQLVRNSTDMMKHNAKCRVCSVTH